MSAADYITLRDAYREVRKVMRDPASSAEEIKAAQDKMGAAYDAYTAANGKLHGNKTGIFQNDPEYYRVLSLEDEKAVLDTKFGKFLKYYEKANVFSTRTYRPRRAPESVASSKDGMLVSMGYRGPIDPDYIAQLTGKTPEEVIQDLQAEGLIFRDPATQEWMHQNRYLSGNVRKKLPRGGDGRRGKSGLCRQRRRLAEDPARADPRGEDHLSPGRTLDSRRNRAGLGAEAVRHGGRT